MVRAADRLRAVRQLYRRRSESATTGDIAYAVYAIILGAAVAAVPAIHALFQALAHPVVLPVLESPAAWLAVALLGGAGLAAVAAVGAVHGPALLAPFLLTVFTGTDMGRHRTLLRPMITATIALTTTIAALAVVVSSVLVLVGTATAPGWVRFTLAATAYGVLLSVVWLVGQRLGPARAWALSALISAATLLTWLAPGSALLTPWGWLGQSWPPAASAAWWPPALLGITAFAALGCVPKLLNGLHGPALLDQAHRWQTAEIATGAGDFAGALATYRAKPRLGRSWRAVTRTRIVTRFLLRDLIGALRTPGRLAAGTVFLALGGFLIAMIYTSAATPAWVPIAVGAAISYAALGVFADGLRHAAETAAAPTLYRYSTAGLYGLHTILPVLWAVVCMLTGFSLAPIGLDFGLLTCLGSLALFLVAARVYDSAKGPLPPMLLTPVSTPAGDLSGLVILAWQADALLIVTITAAAVLTTTQGTALAGAGLFLLATLIMVIFTRQRLRSLR